MNNEQLDDLLKNTLKFDAKTAVDNAAVERVLARLAGPLPRQRQPLWRLRLPAVLVDWQFAPAWPRMAALACSAALGFVIGIAGLDRPFDRLDAPFTVGNRDIGSIVSEPDTLTGERP